MELLKSSIRDIPNFPKPGILFKDITPLLGNPEAFRLSIDLLCERLRDLEVDQIIAIESRGFIFGSAIAVKLGAGFTPVRKPKKLPFKTEAIEYALEYGNDKLEVHIDALENGKRVVIVDDLLATGGTALATAQLVEKIGGKILAFAFLTELSFLEGRSKLKNYRVESLISY